MQANPLISPKELLFCIVVALGACGTDPAPNGTTQAGGASGSGGTPSADAAADVESGTPAGSGGAPNEGGLAERDASSDSPTSVDARPDTRDAELEADADPRADADARADVMEGGPPMTRDSGDAADAVDALRDVRPDALNCIPGVEFEAYNVPGCGANAPPPYCQGPTDACAMLFCGCDGVTFWGGCGFSHVPFASWGACPDAGSDGSSD